MRRATIALAFLAIISLSQAVTLNLAAGASADVGLSAFGATLPALAYTAISFTNGNTAATVNFDPYIGFSLNLGSNAETSSLVSVGLKVTANTQGSGTLTVNLGTLVSGALQANQFVLISTPIASVSGSASEQVIIPPTSTDFSANKGISWSISFQRNYVIVALKSFANIGNSIDTAFQAAFNTTSKIAANSYTTFSASSNAKSSTNTNTASSTSTTNGNAYIAFGNGATGTATQLNVNQFFFGASADGKTYVAPSGTSSNIGTQFSITKLSGTFIGNLTYNSNGQGSFNSAAASSYSWFKAASGNVAASGWTKVASTSSIDASGNLVVTAQQSGDFSEWTVAQSSASSVAAGILAVIVVIALTF